MPHRVLVLMGTRPEAIKLAPVVAALRADTRFEALVVNTGQHRELIDQVIERFAIGVDHDLAVMRPDQTLAGVTARLVEAIDGVLAAHVPDAVLVQGDTTTVLSGALAAFYRRVPVGHVEAGLRTGDLTSPFPEEANRRVASILAEWHFAPTQAAADNLLAEGVRADRVWVTGNTVIDALGMELERQKRAGDDGAEQRALLAQAGADLAERPIVLVTGHRRENFGAGFEAICEALAELAARFADHLFVYPVHLNPNVRGAVHARLGDVENVRLIAPLAYGEFVALMHRCRLVLTDSGGVQEEAPGLGKPVLVMRDTTERPEGVAAGTVKLVGADRAKIVAEASTLLTDPAAYRRMAEATNPYGDGRASGRILEALAKRLA
ncbi:UDP-N-acetylglucosamine 2-epimerase [Pirellulimonas nuda]|uniref:UDP-N-acetylglucosamine 2-epimerase (non-hydrolyzing) n=1 Tax=Pirellulimonas nuda TaxID=2528009 RepID=A0A518D5S5_9BACT|nr:UDP-N-acetylglucosamine 2-epimerase (non-hydrolyzing) [Pirellulimonas nuda]QDU86826.1 UDP-N-acetylglucosamine 2-epimerase [Pirellulimonas nuda]